MRSFSSGLADLVSGALMAAVGAGAALVAMRYGVGSLQNIGPGALPAVVGAVLFFCGLGICVGALRTTMPMPYIAWRPFAAVVGSIAAWVFLAPRVGLFPATVVLVLVAMLAQDKPKFKAGVVTALVLGVGGSFLFIRLLGTPLPMVRGF